MKGKFRYVLIAVAAIFVLLLILPHLINVNQFRPTIESKISAALGRQVQVGSLSLSLLTGTLGADDVSIADDPQFSPSSFLTAKSLKVGVELTPLIFSRAVHVSSVAIENPTITLLKNPAGRWNFSSLASGPARKSGGAAGNASGISIGKIELTTGTLIAGSTDSSNRATYDDVDFEATNVSVAGSFPLKLSAKLPGGGTLKLDGTAGPLDPQDAALTPLDAKLSISGLDLAKSGVADPSSGLGGTLELDSTVSSKSGQANVQGTVKISKFQAAKGASPATAPVAVAFATVFGLAKDAGVLNSGTVKIGKAESRVSGTYDLKGTAPLLIIKFAGENMPVPELAAILPAVGVVLPKGSSLQSGTLTAHTQSSGPVDKLVTTGTIALENCKIAGFDAGSRMSGIGSLSGIGKGPDTTIAKLTSEIRVAPDGIVLSNMDAVIPSMGEATGSGTIAPDHTLHFKMRATVKGPGSLVGLKGGPKIPFAIEGTTSDPIFIPDVTAIPGAVGAEAGSVVKGGAKGAASVVGGLFGKKKKDR